MTQRKRPRGRPPSAAPREPLSPADITRAAALKRYREQNNLNQAEMGSILGVSQATISAYEQARTKIPQDVFEQLVTTAREQVEEGVAPDADTARQRAMDAATALPGGDGDIPPEILDALTNLAGAAEGDPQAAAMLGDTMRMMRDGVAATLPALQKEAVPSVRMAYSLLARILGRFDPDLGTLIDSQSGELAVSLVQAAEVSPLLARLVEMLKVGPMSNFIVLHLMVLVQYDGIRRQRQADARALADVQRAAHPAPEPMHPSATEIIDPEGMGAFGRAA